MKPLAGIGNEEAFPAPSTGVMPMPLCRFLKKMPTSSITVIKAP